MIRHIVRTFKEADAEELQSGIDWYRKAHEFCIDLSFESGLPLRKVIGILAALSPIKSWEENKKIARQFCLTGTHYHTKMHGNKAKNIRDLDFCTDEVIETILSGNKIRSFFHNILYYNSSGRVTLDRHALRVVKHKDSATKKQYKRIEKTYVKATKKINELNGTNYLPLQVQAVVWVKIRNGG